MFLCVYSKVTLYVGVAWNFLTDKRDNGAINNLDAFISCNQTKCYADPTSPLLQLNLKIQPRVLKDPKRSCYLEGKFLLGEINSTCIVKTFDI